jgi:hypothetical protein
MTPKRRRPSIVTAGPKGEQKNQTESTRSSAASAGAAAVIGESI